MNKSQQYDVREEFKKDRLLIVLIISLFIISILALPYLPPRVVIHWNTQGEPDNHMNKFAGTLLLPLIMAAVYLLMVYSPIIDPRKENYVKFKGVYRIMRWVIVLFLYILSILTILYNLGYNINIGRIVPLGVGILFMIIGNYLPQIQRNYFVGIKVPWTLADEWVWKKTHRLAGKLFFIGGIIVAISVFLPATYRFWSVIIVSILIVAGSFIYPLVIFTQHKK